MGVNVASWFSKRMQPTIQYLEEEDILFMIIMIYSLVSNHFSKESKLAYNFGCQVQNVRNVCLTYLYASFLPSSSTVSPGRTTV